MASHFENLKKQILQRLEALENRIYESDVFNTLKEKFQALPPGKQHTLKYLGVGFCLFCVFSIPSVYFFSSSKYLKDFQEKETLSFELLKRRSDSPSVLHQKSAAWVKNSVKNIVERYQKEEYSIVDKKDSGVKKSGLQHQEIKVSVKHLNIKQVVQLGENLNGLGAVRIRRLKVTENDLYKNHYDTDFSILFFPPATEKPLQKRRTSPSLKQREKSGEE